MPPRRELHLRTILNVDDVFDASIRARLEDEGATVIDLTSESALPTVQKNHRCIAVLDWHPITGARRALLRQLRSNNIPTLLYCAEPPPLVSTGRGATFIAKPCPAAKFFAVVNALVQCGTTLPS